MAAAGLLHPTLAAFIHVASEMTFMLNSARLLPRTERSDNRHLSTRLSDLGIAPSNTAAG
jgi:hypothetical protein